MIDADSRTGADDPFTFIGSAAFTGAAQLRVQPMPGGSLLRAAPTRTKPRRSSSGSRASPGSSATVLGYLL